MSLNDLFSANSPSPPPQRAQEESLFFSPGATPLASQRSVRSVSPVSPSHCELHANVNGREIDIEDDPFTAQDPLGPGPLTHNAFSALPDDNDPLNFGGEGEGGGEPAKKRRKMAKVDHERLMAPAGLPRLMKIAKSWKVKGKGREKEDLGLLVDMYTVWAHGMFPKGDFKYTIGRVEAVCRTNRMINSIAGMKDVFYGRNRSASPGGDIPDDADLDGDFNELPDDLAALESNIVASQPGLKSVVSEPLFAPDEDEDELAALAEAEAEASRAQTQQQRPRPTVVDMGDAPIDIGEEDEW
ncbi:hypothetical protein A1Q1_00707 [Trichosporon asahii var. asahii CBS 2479]|uniref:Chromosome segregation in meiosis protein n=1 Tax=Trichosporon asahii var. asahii (strain ATCC 90039 / CBS 2479 / JCM 2466 / KCTC 7840 / NBRC 103889/ NCYC 2677 / UAMH 7654) TaxID=1186058 RepID=J4ULT4_TRIAS|nr:hypothetical protein A1Q1_00707 [Trichosporon asahii var. asahii CBS 2479]EJT52960.1 hypothetical protein A1Q1_00707 [Trichosporon asahii var. asahii CBS 2479]